MPYADPHSAAATDSRARRSAKYRQSHAAQIRQAFREPGLRLLQNLRNRLGNALRGSAKTDTTKALLGCTIEELRAHLEAQFQPGMSWENYGPKGWHIDHKRSCASFDLMDPEQQAICFHYSNLQPLWALDNLRKGAL